MPRVPAVFERKTKWRKLDDTPFDCDKENYKSAEVVAELLESQFEADAEEGMMFRELEAAVRLQYPGDSLRIAVLGTIEKGENSFRVVHDGTHGVHVNNEVPPRDQIRIPGPGDNRAIMQLCSVRPGAHFVLEANVSKAHRRFVNRKEDWGL